MIFLIFAIVCCGIIWLGVAYHRQWLNLAWLSSIPLLAAANIFAGSVFGYDFFHAKIGPIPLTIDRVMWAALMVQFVVWLFLRYIKPKSFDSLDWIVALLLLVLAVSTVAHDFTFRNNLPLSRLLFFNLMPVGIYFVTKHSDISSRQIKWILVAFVTFGAYLSFTSVAEWQGWNGLVFPAYITQTDFTEFLGRGRGPFLNPVACGMFQVVCMSTAVLLFPQASHRIRILLVILMPLFLVGIYSTLTRSVWVSAVLALGLTVWLPAPRRFKGAMLVSGTIVAAVCVTMFSDNFNSFKRDKNVSAYQMAESVKLRPLLADVAFRMLRDKPVFGHGFGQYTQAKRVYHFESTDKPLQKVMPYMQHNVVLAYVAETGLVGTILLVSILVMGIRISWKLYRDSSPYSYRQGFGSVGMVCVMAYFVNGMFHDVSIIPMIGSLFFFILGMVGNLNAANQAEVNLIRIPDNLESHDFLELRKAS